MRCEFILFCLVLGAGFLLTTVNADKGVIVVARSASTPAVAASKAKPTSTPPPPTDEVKPTSAPTKAAAVIINAPPQLGSTTAKQEIKAENVAEPLPLQTPPTEAVNGAPIAAPPRQAKPLQVTGFITRDGNIYEVTDKNGIGRIESRQSVDTENAPHICNYGSVVIYSDVPCEEVTNVHIGEVQTKVINTAEREQEALIPQELQQSAAIADANEASNNSSNNNAVDSSNNSDKPNTNVSGADDEDFNEFDDRPQLPPKKRKRGNKKTNNQRKGYDNSTRRQRPNGSRQGGSNRHRQAQRRQPAQKQKQQQQQQRRRLQNNRNKNQQQRRRLQQQQQLGPQQQQRRNQNDNRRNAVRRQSQRGQGSGNYNRRRYNDYDFDYEQRKL